MDPEEGVSASSSAGKKLHTGNLCGHNIYIPEDVTPLLSIRNSEKSRDDCLSVQGQNIWTLNYVTNQLSQQQFWDMRFQL